MAILFAVTLLTFITYATWISLKIALKFEKTPLEKPSFVLKKLSSLTS